MPKREPIQASGGDEIEADITVSSNCVEVGEILTITMTLTNGTTAPFTFPRTPPVDLVIERNDHAVTNSWSASAAYPPSFDRSIPAGEHRTYVWSWVARAEFAELNGTRSGATLRYIAPPYPYGRALLNFGVHWYSDGEYVVQCHEMR